MEIAVLEGAVAVRDSTDHAHALMFATPSWQAFLDEVKRGAYER